MSFSKKNIILLFFIGMLTATLHSCKESSAVTSKAVENSATAVIKKMGTGFNLGNTFDSNQQSSEPASIKPLIDCYVAAGMQHIRIPVTWMEGFKGDVLADSLGNVNFEHPRFLQLKEVIDYALEKGLYVVINTHHERNFKKTYNNTAAQNAKFANLWTEIATYFKTYPQTLIFELLNEPDGGFGEWGGEIKPVDSLGLAHTRMIGNIGVEAIRNSSPLNKNRVVMITTNGMGNHALIEEVYPSKAELPRGGKDNFIAIQVHSYDPWSFCGQDGKNEEYIGKEKTAAALKAVSAHAKTLGVPVNYGEYGVGRASNQEDRNTDLVREFYQTIVQTTLEEGMSSTVWDDRGWFGLIGKNGNGDYQFIHNIVPFMLP